MRRRPSVDSPRPGVIIPSHQAKAIARTYEYILFDRKERVGIVTLNRPDRLNAWTYDMNDEMHDAIEACNQDPGIGAIIVTGAGRGFCAGADVQGFNNSIEAREAADGRRGAMDGRRYDEHLAAFLRRSKPLIAAVNGPSIGVGLTLTLPMDIRIASEQARFSMRFIRMGITPEVASTTYLPQIVGLQSALDLILTARIIDAPEALRMGLVARVVPGDQLMDAALAVASEIASNPPGAGDAGQAHGPPAHGGARRRRRRRRRRPGDHRLL